MIKRIDFKVFLDTLRVEIKKRDSINPHKKVFTKLGLYQKLLKLFDFIQIFTIHTLSFHK